MSETVSESSDPKVLEEMDNISLDRWLRENVESLPTREAYDCLITTTTGIESSEFSLLYFLTFLKSCGGYHSISGAEGAAQEWKIHGGTQQIAEALAEKLGSFGTQVVLNDRVTSVDQSKGGVVVKTRSGKEYKAKYCICSVPLHLTNNIHFNPPLPPARRQLAMRTPMGSIIKVVVFYKEPFWSKLGLSGEAVSVDGPVRLFFDATQKDGTLPALVGFLCGRHARQYSGKTAERKAAVIDQIALIFGEEGRDYVEYIDKDWLEDEFADGCYCGISGMAVLSAFGHMLSKPFRFVHFAGTETAEQWSGYFEGAIISALRVVDEIKERSVATAKL